MRPIGAALVGFHDQGNLGIGYLAATLRINGFAVSVLDFREGPSAILEAIQCTRPEVVGFSLIFQYYLPQFAQLADYLRNNGIDALFCAGGHFPSLRHEEVLQAVPSLDCVVRGEGGLTLLELMQRLAGGHDWHDVAGIAYRDGENCVTTPLRPLVPDLDSLPFPDRSKDSLTILGKNVRTLIASRGCAHDCSFCSIRQFYLLSPGRKVRVRNPSKVVEEMKALHEENGVLIFAFQDDDFPIRGASGRRWVARFLEELRCAELAGRTIWKISCRTDEVDPDLILAMRDAGLYMVYLGLESGNAAGLQLLNKSLTVGDNLRAVARLRELELAVAYGFMMFDPSSSFDSVRANVAFLRQVTADGSLPVMFCRMLPYAGTPIEAALDREGRLHGSSENPEYDFVDPRLHDFFASLSPLLNQWEQTSEAPAFLLNWAWNEYWIMRRLFPPLEGLPAYREALRTLTRRCNEYFLELVEKGVRFHEGSAGGSPLPEVADFQNACRRFHRNLLKLRDAFVARNQKTMLRSLSTSPVSLLHKNQGPAISESDSI